MSISALGVKGLDIILMRFYVKEFPCGYLQGVQSCNLIELHVQCMNKIMTNVSKNIQFLAGGIQSLIKKEIKRFCQVVPMPGWGKALGILSVFHFRHHPVTTQCSNLHLKVIYMYRTSSSLNSCLCLLLYFLFQCCVCPPGTKHWFPTPVSVDFCSVAVVI